MTAPANDNYANAALLTGASGTVNGTNIEATEQSADGVTRPVWYQWTAPSSGSITFDTLSSTDGSDTNDTYMFVRTGATYPGTLVTENDDYGAAHLSRCVWTAVAGTTYYIGVGGYGAMDVTFKLTWTSAGGATGGGGDGGDNTTVPGNPGPGTSYLVSVADVTGGGAPSPTILISGVSGSVPGDTVGTTGNLRTRPRWYVWTSPETYYYRFDTFASIPGTQDTWIYVLTVDSAGTVQMVDVKDSVGAATGDLAGSTFPGIGGQVYYIGVGTHTGDDINYVLTWGKSLSTSTGGGGDPGGGTGGVVTPVPPPPQMIINDRDVWLQSYAERFTKVTAQYGNTVNLAQANSTGIVLSASRSLDLAASSQVFRVGASMVEPPWIMFTPTLRNLSGTPAYSVVSGSATLAPSGDKAQLLYGGMAGNRVTVKASLSAGGVTYTDQVTVVKIVEGGSDIAHVLSNESLSLMADSVGNVLSYTGASGDFRVWQGAVEVTSACSFAVTANASDLLMSISNLGRYAVTGIPTAVNSATVTLQATFGGATYSETLTVTKLLAPAGTSSDPATQTVGGKRLPMTLTVPITGTAWDNATANAALTAYGGPVLNDTVTEYNNSATPPFTETRFWNYTQWVTLDAKVDGNLLVTGSIGVDKLSADAVQAFSGTFQQLVTDALTAARAEIDTLIADQIDAVNGNFDTLTVGGTQILPNSINTGHVVDNAINVPIIMESAPAATVGDPYNSGALSASYTGPATAIITVSVQVGANAGSDATVNIDILLDGSSAGSKAFTAAAGQVSSFVMQKQVSVAAGSHTWAVVFSSPSGDYSLASYTMTVMGVMK